MAVRNCFNSNQMALATRAGKVAAGLVTEYYKIAPREWSRMPYEVRTLRSLDESEVVDHALAHTLCFEFRRQAGPFVLDEGELYRICLQDHRILNTAVRADARLSDLLTYVLTHELVHVVRFGQRLQEIDLPFELRPREERNVERTTRNILSSAGLRRAASLFPSHRLN